MRTLGFGVLVALAAACSGDTAPAAAPVDAGQDEGDVPMDVDWGDFPFDDAGASNTERPCPPPVFGETALEPEWVTIPAGPFVFGSAIPEHFEFPEKRGVFENAYRIQTAPSTSVELDTVRYQFTETIGVDVYGCEQEPLLRGWDGLVRQWPTIGSAMGHANRRSVLEGLERCFPLHECELPCLPDDHDAADLYAYQQSLRACDDWALSQMSVHCEGYRLPTEAEWEWAARGATESLLCPDQGECLDRYAWWAGNEDLGQWGREVGEVGGLCPNPVGMYDVLGLLPELTADVVQAGQSVNVFVDVEGQPRRPRPALTLVRGEDGHLTAEPDVEGAHPDACEFCQPIVRGGGRNSPAERVTVTRVEVASRGALRLVQTITE